MLGSNCASNIIFVRFSNNKNSWRPPLSVLKRSQWQQKLLKTATWRFEAIQTKQRYSSYWTDHLNQARIFFEPAIWTVKGNRKCTRKCNGTEWQGSRWRFGNGGLGMEPREWGPRNGVLGMRVSEWSLGNGAPSSWHVVGWSSRLGTWKNRIYRALFFSSFWSSSNSFYTVSDFWQVISPAWRFHHHFYPPFPIHTLDYPLPNYNLLPLTLFRTDKMTDTFNSKFCGAIQKLNSLNHLQWSSSMTQHFASTEINDIVQGQRSCPPAGSEEREISSWKRDDSRAKGALLGACTPAVASNGIGMM